MHDQRDVIIKYAPNESHKKGTYKIVMPKKAKIEKNWGRNCLPFAAETKMKKIKGCNHKNVHETKKCFYS